jgi:hypothetical protein
VREIRQDLDVVDMCSEGVLLAPRITEMYDDVLETIVEGAAYDIRDVLAVNGLRQGFNVNSELYAKILWAHSNPDAMQSGSEVKVAPMTGMRRRNGRDTYIRFMLDQSGNDLPMTFENLRRADSVANFGQIILDEVIAYSHESAYVAMIEANDPRPRVAESLVSLGLGHHLSSLYDNEDRAVGLGSDYGISDFQQESTSS